MRRGTTRIAALLLLASVSLEAFALPAEESASAPASAFASAPASAFASATAQPGALPPGFKEGTKENPWRRFEIIAFGAYPIVLFYVGFGHDLYRYASNDFASEYAPWPFKSDNSVDPDESELYLRLAIAGGISLVFSGVDALLHQAKLRKSTAPAADAPELDSAVPPD